MRGALRGFAVFAVCIGSSISADAAAPLRLAKPDVSARVLRMHRAVLQLLPLIVKGGGRHDSASTSTNVNCPGGGSLSATVSGSSSNSGTSSGSVSYTVTFTDCKTTDDTLGGGASFTYTASASNGGATNSISVVYNTTSVVLKSVSSDPIVAKGLTITTTATTTSSGSGGTTTKNTGSGTVSVAGTPYTYSNDPLEPVTKP